MELITKIVFSQNGVLHVFNIEAPEIKEVFMANNLLSQVAQISLWGQNLQQLQLLQPVSKIETMQDSTT